MTHATGAKWLTLGARIRVAREASGKSLRALATLVDKSPAFISDIELGRRHPSAPVLANIAKTLNVDLQYLQENDIRPHRVFTELRELIRKDPGWLTALNLLLQVIQGGGMTPGSLIASMERHRRAVAIGLGPLLKDMEKYR